MHHILFFFIVSSIKRFPVNCCFDTSINKKKLNSFLKSFNFFFILDKQQSPEEKEKLVNEIKKSK